MAAPTAAPAARSKRPGPSMTENRIHGANPITGLASLPRTAARMPSPAALVEFGRVSSAGTPERR